MLEVESTSTQSGALSCRSRSLIGLTLTTTLKLFDVPATGTALDAVAGADVAV
jgi:hypothetical protein